MADCDIVAGAPQLAHVGFAEAIVAVKSMLGESLTASEVGPRGLDGDRTHALIHRGTGKIASAKHPRLWRDLLTLTATATGDGVRVTAPDGSP